MNSTQISKNILANTLYLLAGFLLFAQSDLNAQTSQFVSNAEQHLKEKTAEWNLVKTDLDELRLTDSYQSEHNDVRHLYFIQQHHGIDVYQAMASVAVDDRGKVLYASQNFVSDLSEKIQPAHSSISAAQAVQTAISDRGYEPPLLKRSSTKQQGEVVEFEKIAGYSHAPRAQKVYFRDKNGALRLHWDVSFFKENASDYWSMRIDAESGAITEVGSFTEHCSFPSPSGEPCGEPIEGQYAPSPALAADSGQYVVFPVPLESPIHGERDTVTAPVYEPASPFGWHDTNSVDGPEFTTLRGNNVNAVLDRSGDFLKDTGAYDADGGEELIFEFPFDDELEPIENAAADVTNLFYMNNYMHDFSYAYGFDEAAGNFQTTNYSGEGAGNDNVLALSQFDANSGNTLNNATFSTPSDGSGNGTMRMFVWDQGAGGSEYLEVTAPPAVAGAYEAQPADFGGEIPEDPLEAEMVFVEDGVSPFTDACDNIQNGAALEGKIALIDRGQCEFGSKILRAEENGAIAAIVINNQPTGLVTMAGGIDGAQVTIPGLFITLQDGQTIRSAVGNGLTGTIKEPNPGNVTRLSSALDNGIIAHEYGHGISNRLTGGPAQAGCLGNAEQMGEGWSDFFTLVTSVREGDTGEKARGIGNYVTRQGLDGRGIRAYPYSTDMEVNPVTYYSIFDASVPHGVGQVWASMLWDLYWALVDRYGFDSDLINGDGGNNIAVQLVMDGFKLQPCEPGFVTGRDAILAADRINNDGANQCLIWEVFARRGLGFSAEQGSPLDIQDAKEAYDIKPSCSGKLDISKSMSPTIEPGDIFDVQIKVTNYTDQEASGLVVSDLVPDGCTYVPGSANISPEVNEDILNFDIEPLDTMAEVVIEYELESSAQNSSEELVFDGFEETPDERWFTNPITGSNIFELSEEDPYKGTQSWFIPNTENDNDTYLANLQAFSVSGEKPIMRFFHKYNTEAGFDGGIVEYSFDATNWDDMGDRIFRGDYRGRITYTTFALVDQEAFWGNSEDWVPTYIDLSDFAGQEIYIRFRYGEVQGGSQVGWNIDDFGIYDMLNYQSEACVTSDQGANNCDAADGRGTFVEYKEGTNTLNPRQDDQLTVYPNPAEETVFIRLKGKTVKDATVRLRDVTGTVLYEKFYSSMRPGANYSITLSNLSPGMYIVEWQTDASWNSKKIFKH